MERRFLDGDVLIAEAALDSRVMNDEPFGPLAMLNSFATTEDAIREANRLPFGLAAYCFTEQGRRQNQLAEEVESGMIAMNGVRMSWPDSPFGGVKESGFGSEDGPEGVEACQVIKSISMA